MFDYYNVYDGSTFGARRIARIRDTHADAPRTIGSQEWPTFFSFTFSPPTAPPI